MRNLWPRSISHGTHSEILGWNVQSACRRVPQRMYLYAGIVRSYQGDPGFWRCECNAARIDISGAHRMRWRALRTLIIPAIFSQWWSSWTWTLIGTCRTRSTRYMSCVRHVAFVAELPERKYACARQSRGGYFVSETCGICTANGMAGATSFPGKFPFDARKGWE